MKRFYLAGRVSISQHTERIGMFAIADTRSHHRIVAYVESFEEAEEEIQRLGRLAAKAKSTKGKKAEAA